MAPSYKVSRGALVLFGPEKQGRYVYTNQRKTVGHALGFIGSSTMASPVTTPTVGRGNLKAFRQRTVWHSAFVNDGCCSITVFGSSYVRQYTTFHALA